MKVGALGPRAARENIVTGEGGGGGNGMGGCVPSETYFDGGGGGIIFMSVLYPHEMRKTFHHFTLRTAFCSSENDAREAQRFNLPSFNY